MRSHEQSLYVGVLWETSRRPSYISLTKHYFQTFIFCSFVMLALSRMHGIDLYRNFAKNAEQLILVKPMFWHV